MFSVIISTKKMHQIVKTTRQVNCMAWVMSQTGKEIMNCVAFRIKRLEGYKKTFIEGRIIGGDSFHILGEFDSEDEAISTFKELYKTLSSSENPSFDFSKQIHSG